MPVQLPAVHLNGNSKQDLVLGLQKAYDAVEDALRAMRESGTDLIHMRNYYVLPDGDEAGKRARDQYWARQEKLLEVKKELEELLLGVLDGGAR